MQDELQHILTNLEESISFCRGLLDKFLPEVPLIVISEVNVQIKDSPIGHWFDDDLVQPGRYFDKLVSEEVTGLVIHDENAPKIIKKNNNRVDIVFEIVEGEIVEIGNHHELMNKDGYYKKLYNYQFKFFNAAHRGSTSSSLSFFGSGVEYFLINCSSFSVSVFSCILILPA